MSPTASKGPSPSPDAPSEPSKAKETSPDAEEAKEESAAPEASTSASPSNDVPGPEPAAEPSSAQPPAPSTSTGALAAGDWQAIWAPTYNAYYFYNAVTQQTTWENPLQQGLPPAASSSASPAPADGQPSGRGEPASAAQIYALQEAAIAQGIDPSLAYLDPSLAGPAGPSGAYAFTAKFNARTGAFAKPEGRDPSHLSEYERAKRMSEVYFDVGAWEQEVEKRKKEEEENGKKRKRPTKKDLERFKEQKRQKKIAKTAWLRT